MQMRLNRVQQGEGGRAGLSAVGVVADWAAGNDGRGGAWAQDGHWRTPATLHFIDSAAVELKGRAFRALPLFCLLLFQCFNSINLIDLFSLLWGK